MKYVIEFKFKTFRWNVFETFWVGKEIDNENTFHDITNNICKAKTFESKEDAEKYLLEIEPVLKERYHKYNKNNILKDFKVVEPIPLP